MEKDTTKKTDQQSIDLIQNMTKHEELIRQLYFSYSEKFIDNKSFWLHISEEEKDHADWINTLLKKIHSESIFFNRDHFKVGAIQSSMKFIQEMIVESKFDDIDELTALAVALDIENALLEKEFFQIFESDSAEIKDTFFKLQVQTEEHREEIKNFLNKKKAEIS